MSYSFKWEGPAGRAVDALLNSESILRVQEDQHAAVEEHRELAAKLVAAFVGQLNGYTRVAVVVSGHANPMHGPAFGWASDMLSVTVQAIP